MYITAITAKEAWVGDVFYSGNPRGSFVLVKCNPMGIVQWVKNVQDVPVGGANYLMEIICDKTGNIYYVVYGGMLSIVKLDSSGNVIWEQFNQNISMLMDKMIIDIRGNILVAGSARGRFKLGQVEYISNNYEIFVGKFNPDGEWQWIIHGNGGYNDSVEDFTQDPITSDLYIVGRLSSKTLSFGDIKLPSTSFVNRSFVLKVRQPFDKLILDLGADMDICPGEDFELQLNGFFDYEWQDGSTDSVMQISEPGVYYVKAFDSGGRQQTDTIHVKSCFQSTIPNVITPNGDTYNDTFVIERLNMDADNALFIFDRWGKNVYSTSAYRNDWNGCELASGTYFYELHNASDLKTYKGWVQILR